MSTILVVDDNAQNRLLAQAALEDEGHDVMLAENGQLALVLFEQGQPDCVLLDIRMPGMDGFEVCRRLRELPGGRETPVIFVTALRDVENFDEALKAGADDFLTKPIRPTELLVRVQAALRMRSLNQEIREHVELVQHQRNDLLRLQLQTEQLMAFVVHDLKNPVNSLDLRAQLLLRKQDLPDFVRPHIEQIRGEARSLMRLILNLLDISKGEEEALSPQPTDVDVERLMREVVDALSARASITNVTIEHSTGVKRVRADEDLLRRTLENLLENALRHAPDNSRVTLAATADDGVKMRVSDEGRGVPEQFRERIFQRFVQLESESAASRAGRGLGLAFCKLAVEAQGGRIWVEDANPGAVFCFELPE